MHDDRERESLYRDRRADLLKRQLSNSEHFDRSVLALSSALLAASIAFIRPSDSITPYAGLLAASWIALGVAITSTLVSFVVSQKAIDIELELAEKYYRQRQDDALTAANKSKKWVVRLNLLSGIAFIVGVGLTLWFAILSIPRS